MCVCARVRVCVCAQDIDDDDLSADRFLCLLLCVYTVSDSEQTYVRGYACDDSGDDDFTCQQEKK